MKTILEIVLAQLQHVITTMPSSMKSKREKFPELYGDSFKPIYGLCDISRKCLDTEDTAHFIAFMDLENQGKQQYDCDNKPSSKANQFHWNPFDGQVRERWLIAKIKEQE